MRRMYVSTARFRELAKAEQLSMFGGGGGGRAEVQVRAHARVTKQGKVAQVKAHTQKREARARRDPMATHVYARARRDIQPLLDTQGEDPGYYTLLRGAIGRLGELYQGGTTGPALLEAWENEIHSLRHTADAHRGGMGRDTYRLKAGKWHGASMDAGDTLRRARAAWKPLPESIDTTAVNRRKAIIEAASQEAQESVRRIGARKAQQVERAQASRRATLPGPLAKLTERHGWTVEGDGREDKNGVMFTRGGTALRVLPAAGRGGSVVWHVEVGSPGIGNEVGTVGHLLTSNELGSRTHDSKRRALRTVYNFMQANPTEVKAVDAKAELRARMVRGAKLKEQLEDAYMDPDEAYRLHVELDNGMAGRPGSDLPGAIAAAEKALVAAEAPSESSEPAGFQVGDTLTMRSPHTGEDTRVHYRGKIGDDATVIMPGGMQMSVPIAWLR